MVPEGRRRGWKPAPTPFLRLTAREDSSTAEIVDLLQVQEKTKERIKSPPRITTGTRDHAQDHANSVREERKKEPSTFTT